MNAPQTAPLSPDTEAILLLCGRFGGERGEEHGPLAQKEYESLTRWLLERKLRPADLLGAALGDLVHAGLAPARVEALLARGTALALALEKWRRSGLWVLSRGDAAYPKRLKKKLGHSAPPLLYGAGDPMLLDGGGLAMVGSRDASESILEFTREVARACARDGLGVISGGAKGVDAAAMQGAGEAEGSVIGVLAADLLRASVNRQNRLGIQSGRLVLVSPFNPEAGFNAGNAMARNRYIYALADYALVVDSADGEGGTWAGAVENLRHGWTPLYVRTPGEKQGNAALIAKGGLGFTYSPAERESLRAYIEADGQVDDATLFKPEPQAPDLPVTAPVAPATVVSESEKVTETGRIDQAAKTASDQIAPASLDMFQAFLERMPVLLKDAAKTDEEIRIALGLEKGQTKAWLAAAVERGHLEKRKRPVAYALPRQKTLC